MQTITQKATDGQIKQLVRLGTDAIDRIFKEHGIDKVGAQRVIEHGDEFSIGIRECLKSLLADLSTSDKYWLEEIGSSISYLSGYHPRTVAEQLKRLHELLPLLNCFVRKPEQAMLPEGAEGWFAIPRWERIAPTYGEAVNIVLNLLAKEVGQVSHHFGDPTYCLSRYLTPQSKTAAAFQRIAGRQRSDVLIVPAQFGLLHRGRSVRRARAVFDGTEFGLGAFAVGIMLLTHPERLLHERDLWIDCAGDEYDEPHQIPHTPMAPVFRYLDGTKGLFSTRCLYLASGCHGSASGFIV